MSKKINPKSIVYQGKTSIFIFLYPTLLALGMIWYFFNTKTFSSFLISLSISFIVYFIAFLNFSKKQIFLTKNSVYIYMNERIKFSSLLVEDLYKIEIRQDKLGIFLNYGTLVIINKDNNYYEFFVLDNPKKCMDNIMTRYERNMKKIDPNFVSSYVLTEKQKENKEDELDKIGDENEK